MNRAAESGALRLGTWAAVLGPMLLYALALNPYPLPDTYDNVLYQVAAQALVDTGSYTFGGWSIWDWPPGFPALVAVPVLLGLGSILVSKVVVLLGAALAAALAFAVLRREERTAPRLAVAIAMLSPTAFLQGTRVMSDWPFAALGLLFLYLLPRLTEESGFRRRAFRSVMLGLVLGGASLTRHVGVCLGAAVLVQMAAKWRRTPAGGRLRAVCPEVIAGGIGAVLFVGWRVIMIEHVDAGQAWSDYQRELGFLKHLSLAALGEQVWDVTMHGAWSVRRLTESGALTAGFALVVLALVVGGAVRQIRERGVRPSDAYVFAVVLLCSNIEWKHSRYLLPIAPFLVSYLLAGLGGVAAWLQTYRLRLPRVVVTGALALWIVALTGMNGYLLVAGNDESHRGLSPFVSGSPEEFYSGHWADLHAASAHLGQSPGHGAVLVVGRDDLKYPAFLTRRPIARLPRRAGRIVVPDAAALCRMAPPYRPGRGLHLFAADGSAMGPLWVSSNGGRGHTHGDGCALSHVLVAGEEPVPDDVNDRLALGPAVPFGSVRIHEVLGPVTRVSAP